MNVLMVAAHPDDEVLGAGGTLARHIRQGDQVTILILGSGLSSRLDTPTDLPSTDMAALQKDARNAADLLGVRDLRLLDLPDNRFDRVEGSDIDTHIEAVVAEVAPETVYTHHPGDLNIDHQRTAQATLTACRPLPGSLVRRILAMEVASATGWGNPDQPFIPTVFINIATELPQKLAAMGAYRSELREFPHARSLKSLEARALAWGSQAGLAAAEPFVLLRELQP